MRFRLFMILVCAALLVGSAYGQVPFRADGYTDEVEYSGKSSKSYWLVPVDEGLCYLTKTSGDFRGTSERLWLDQAEHPSFGNKRYWRFSGQGGAGTISGKAQCVRHTKGVPTAIASGNALMSWEQLTRVGVTHDLYVGTLTVLMSVSNIGTGNVTLVPYQSGTALPAVTIAEGETALARGTQVTAEGSAGGKVRVVLLDDR